MFNRVLTKQLLLKRYTEAISDSIFFSFLNKLEYEMAPVYRLDNN